MVLLLNVECMTPFKIFGMGSVKICFEPPTAGFTVVICDSSLHVLFCCSIYSDVLSSPYPEIQFLTIGSILCNMAIRWLMTSRYNHSWFYTLFHPIASLIVMEFY